jgi:hypothetical protein
VAFICGMGQAQPHVAQKFRERDFAVPAFDVVGRYKLRYAPARMKICPIFPSSSISRVALGVSRIAVRNASSRSHPKKVKGPSGQPEGHGREIWLFNHMEANHTVYSFNNSMKVRERGLAFQLTRMFACDQQLIFSMTVPSCSQADPFQWQEVEAREAPQGLLAAYGHDTISRW